jgi:ATP:corrinoid adenosyltransferase
LGAKAIEHGAAERRTRHGLTIVYTGLAELIEVADLVSQVQPIKHPFDKGINPQRGIEF